MDKVQVVDFDAIPSIPDAPKEKKRPSKFKIQLTGLGKKGRIMQPDTPKDSIVRTL